MERLTERLRFYISHSWNDMRVSKVRTFFALLCIAAGVAAVISLQTLGVMIENTLTGDLQELNRGDIRIRVVSERPSTIDRAREQGYVLGTTAVRPVFTDKGIAAIEAWFRERDPDVQISYRHLFPRDLLAAGVITKTDGETVSVPGYIVDIQQYPMYGEIRTLDGKTLPEVMVEPTDIVISDNAAYTYDLRVGDKVTLGGTESVFTIRGIVKVEVEALYNFESTFSGFYYVDLSAVPLYSAYDPELGESGNRYAVELYVKLSDNDRPSVNNLAQQFERRFPFTYPRTTTDLEELNSQVSGAINDLVLIMGLVSMLIGGIGIIQTMMVIIARRMNEIAILKTVGFQATQVTQLFFVESVLFGIIGSILGILLGIPLSKLTQTFGEYFLSQDLTWVFDGLTMVRGFAIGVVITVIFGLLPTLIAGQVRPGSILRPNDPNLPRTSIFQTILALSVIFIVIGIMSWTILGGGLSPDPNELWWSLITFGLAFGIAIAIGGGAIASSLSIVRKSPFELGSNSLAVQWLLLCIGILVQTILEGILFFALGIILIVLIFEKLTVTYGLVMVAIAAILGLVFSIASFRHQRTIPLTLGTVLVGFVGSGLLGTALGAMLGLPLYLGLHENLPEVWTFIIELASNIILIELAIILLGIIGGILWLLIAVSAHFPTFGSPDLKLALRSLSENRNRVSTTVLALVIGILTASLVVMLTISIQRLFEVSLIENLGGNVFMVTTPQEDWHVTADQLSTTIEGTEGVKSYSIATNYAVEFVEVIKADGTRQNQDQLQANINVELKRLGQKEGQFNQLLNYSLTYVDGRSVDQPEALPDRKFTGSNRQLNAGDTGKRRVVVVGNEAMVFAGIKAGDILVFDFPGNQIGDTPRRLKFEVVGISDELGNITAVGSNTIYAPVDAFGEIPPNAVGAVVDIDEDKISSLRRRIAENVPGTLVLETAFLNRLINEFVKRFISLPILVSALALITSATVIANSVALSTMERRREIAVMKAIGLQRERVLGMLLFENSLMGFLGGTIGVGASILLLIGLWSLLFEDDLSDAIPIGWALLLMGICVAISILASIFSVWHASGEKPLNVLRYE